jgi:hypothetical protein
MKSILHEKDSVVSIETLQRTVLTTYTFNVRNNLKLYSLPTKYILAYFPYFEKIE